VPHEPNVRLVQPVTYSPVGEEARQGCIVI